MDNELCISRLIFTREPYKSLSHHAKWLYVVLKDLDLRFNPYYGDVKGFTRTNEQLAADCGVSVSTLKRAKAELLATGLVKMEQKHNVCMFKRLMATAGIKRNNQRQKTSREYRKWKHRKRQWESWQEGNLKIWPWTCARTP